VLSQPGWHKRLSDMIQTGNVPLPGVFVMPADAGAVYGALSDDR